MASIIKTNFTRPTVSVIEKFKQFPPSDYGHRINFNLIGNRKIKPIKKVIQQFAGPAITVRIPPNDSILVYKALELAQPGDVIVIDMNGEDRYACWGEITTRVAKERGVIAAVINGPVTDSLEIEKLGLDVYATNISPLTTKVYSLDGDINVPLAIDGVVINPGDIIVGNNDGLLVVPQTEVEAFMKIGQEEFQADEGRRQKLQDAGVDTYLADLNVFLKAMDIEQK